MVQITKKSNIFWLLWMCCGLGLEGYIPKPIRPELSEAMWKGVSLVVIFIFCIFNFKKKPFKTGIDRSFTYIVASIFISIGMAYIYHDQTIDIGFRASSVYLIFVTFFVLKRSTINKQEILVAIMIMGCLQIITSVCALLTMPDPIFGSVEVDEGRGGFRLRVGSFEWLLVILCYSCNQWLILKKPNYKYLVIFSFWATFVSLTRQYMAISSLVLLFYILRGKSKFIKVLAICAFLGAATYVYNSEIGQSIVEMTIKQRDDSAYKEEDVRIWDLKYFLDKGQEDVLTYLFGNGVYSAKDSRLGRILGKHNCYPADVGMAGYIFYFGLFSFAALLYVCYYSIRIRKSKEDSFLNVFIVAFLMCSVIAGSIVYANSLFILILMIYYIPISKNNIYDRNSHIKFQQ